ncbi:MAG: NAD(P)-dependent oxidoreductase [Anaerolineae bacterium]|jgi:nucleoside-diphosphate-sugar epimerase|nr:NAD(P)-dependent oxidoreductase [Anaerolineae bacterium]
MLQDQTILVTGGTGFLGGEIIRTLAAQGAVVRALVRDPARADYIGNVPNVTLIQGDLTRPETLPAAIDGVRYVIHSAAALSGDLPSQLKANRDGTRALALSAARAGVDRFVHVSTISLYGYRHRGVISEDTPPMPGHDPYPISKLAAETVLRQIAATEGLRYSILRPGMIYGPRSGMWTGRMYALAKQSPTIFIGDGSGSCYPIHVSDVVDLTLLLLTHPNALDETFNCTPDPSPTWREFLGGYSQLAGHQAWFAIPPALIRPIAAFVSRFAPKDSPLCDLADLVPFSQSQITYSHQKARDCLGWQPKIALADGIAACRTWLESAR